MFSAAASRIFVTDPLLVQHAKRSLPGCEDKIQSITFGAQERNRASDRMCAVDNLEKQVRNLRSHAMDSNRHFSLLLCLGTPDSTKSLHFDYLPALLDRARQVGRSILAIVGGAFGDSKIAQARLAVLRTHPQIILFEDQVTLPDCFIVDYVDFYWRGYSDFSVPFTVYEAAALQKPILALDSGFLPEMVSKCGIGAVVRRDFSDLEMALERMRACEPEDYEKFLSSRTWDSLGCQIAILRRNAG